MKYVLQPLLTVRRFREDAAANATIAQRGKVAAAEAELAKRRAALAEYDAWRIRREEELWQSIIGRQVQNKDIDNLKLDLQIVWAGQVERQEAVFEGEKSLEEAREKLAEAIVAHRKAMRSREKLDMHKDMWRDAKLKEAEYAADIELEDFKVRKPIVAA
jgi:type III secretion protein O